MNELPNLIQNGMFGQTQPMNGGMYNPYQNQGYMAPLTNMIPVGSYNYNQTSFQQQPTNYVFQPIGNGYNPNPYSVYNQPRQDYYNPFPQYQQTYQPYYSYNNYYNYSPFMSMQMQQDMIKMEVNKNKIKYRICATYLGQTIDEDYIDELYNPNNKKNIKSDEELKEDRQWREVISYHQASLDPNNMAQTPQMQLAQFLRRKITNYHQYFDNHSMCEFFEEDYPRLEREFWIEENIKRNGLRDMSTTYNSKAYNELLNLHHSSNPYINEIMNNARYDNNLDDMEIGLAEMFERERRRRNLLEGKLPQYISSPEIQKARAEYTQQLMDQIYKKEMKRNNV